MVGREELSHPTLRTMIRRVVLAMVERTTRIRCAGVLD
jgi:hypothetical protein